MKKQSLRSRADSTTPIPVRHQFDHEVPTVIHHPEEKMTALARLTHRVILDPGKYVTWALGILAVVLAIVVASNWTSSSRTKNVEVWTKLDSPTKPEDLTETAKEYPGTPHRNGRSCARPTSITIRPWPTCPITARSPFPT